MESLQVRTGQISLQILDDNGDPRGVFKFIPTDIESAKQVLELQKDIDVKSKEFHELAKQADTADKQINLLSDIVDYFEGRIDSIFGQGSSKILFGDAKTLSMFEDFIVGIIPYYEKASKERISKYTKTRKRK